MTALRGYELGQNDRAVSTVSIGLERRGFFTT
jgi:hypothetical protein